jgi:hypothetical protein
MRHFLLILTTALAGCSSRVIVPTNQTDTNSIPIPGSAKIADGIRGVPSLEQRIECVVLESLGLKPGANIPRNPDIVFLKAPSNDAAYLSSLYTAFIQVREFE